MKTVTNIVIGTILVCFVSTVRADGVYTIGQLKQDDISLQNAPRYAGKLSDEHREILNKMVGYVVGSAEQYVLQTGCIMDSQYSAYYNLVDLVTKIASKLEPQYDGTSSAVLIQSVMRNVCIIKGEI